MGQFHHLYTNPPWWGSSNVASLYTPDQPHLFVVWTVARTILENTSIHHDIPYLNRSGSCPFCFAEILSSAPLGTVVQPISWASLKQATLLLRIATVLFPAMGTLSLSLSALPVVSLWSGIPWPPKWIRNLPLPFPLPHPPITSMQQTDFP